VTPAALHAPRPAGEAGSAPAEDSVPVVRVRPPHGAALPDLRELWAYRELLYFLVWRDVKVRYKQTALGAAWAILQPFATMVVFSLFFGRLAGMPSEGVPYPVFSYAALVPWTFFANGVTTSTASLVANQGLVTKVYFPRVAIPIAAVLAGLVDFALAFLVLLGMMLHYGITPGARSIWLLPLLLLALLTSLGVGLWLSAMNVRYRDVGYVVPFLVQLLLFSTPIAYPSSLLDEPWRTLYALNPMVGVVEGFRWALLGTGTTPGGLVAVSGLVALALLASGALYFRGMERTFADRI
jgi:lipopolysaccharide transport system permease protein